MSINFIDAVLDELLSASEKSGAFNSPHEGYAVLLEEMDELWTEIKKKSPNVKQMRREAIQIGAMAIRFLYDCCQDD